MWSIPSPAMNSARSGDIWRAAPTRNTLSACTVGLKSSSWTELRAFHWSSFEKSRVGISEERGWRYHPGSALAALGESAPERHSIGFKGPRNPRRQIGIPFSHSLNDLVTGLRFHAAKVLDCLPGSQWGSGDYVSALDTTYTSSFRIRNDPFPRYWTNVLNTVST